MTTSFNLTRNQIAARVLGKVIKIGAATPISADSDTVYQAIDLRLKELHKYGIFWRKTTSVPATFSLTSGIVSASAGSADILFPVKMTWTNTTSDDPVYLIGPREYAAIDDKTRTGNPERALWKGGSEFLFYPVPSANGTAKLLYEKIIDDTSASATVDVDQSMLRCLIDLVKYDVADDYGVLETTQLRWKAEAKQAELDIRRLNALRVDFLPVRVDDFDNRQPNSNRLSDYGF